MGLPGGLKVDGLGIFTARRMKTVTKTVKLLPPNDTARRNVSAPRSYEPSPQESQGW